MTENPNRTADVLPVVRQERLENAVEELVAVKEAGTLGKSREKAHEDNDEVLQSEFADATEPPEDGQPPLIRTDPALPPGTVEFAGKVIDAGLSTYDLPPLAESAAKVGHNLAEALSAEGSVENKLNTFLASSAINGVKGVVEGDNQGPPFEPATDDAKSYAKAVIDARYGGPPPSSSDEQGPMIR